MTVKWSDLNLEGAATARDLWSKTNLGSFDASSTVSVPSHGVVMLKVVVQKLNCKKYLKLNMLG
ncbi:MAG: hypothetical protein IPO21_16680 [Bacteroidales bacterium]|nr:hypothetical protein [Bacteroidales bacterium]